MNDVELKIVDSYLKNGLHFLNTKNREFYEKFSEYYPDIKMFPEDRPDLYIELNKGVIAIEHFQFDASNLFWGKSSSDKKVLAENYKEFNEELKKLKKGSILKHYKRDLDYNLGNYIKNFKRNFKKHYDNIDIYKKRIIKHTSAINEDEIIIIFFIEDRNPLGSYYHEDGKIKFFTIFQIKEILDFLKTHLKVDYIFNGYYDSKKNKTTSIKNDLETIGICESFVIDFNKCRPIFFTPNETRWGSIITDVEKDK